MVTRASALSNNLDIRNNNPEMLTEVSLKMKKSKKKFPGGWFLDFPFAILKAAVCTYQGG
jgi:hypothetical protein